MASDSDRRINLSFDDLELDILKWLNSFGKRKRARVAKEAIRWAVINGFNPLSMIVHSTTSDISENRMDQIRTRGIEPEKFEEVNKQSKSSMSAVNESLVNVSALNKELLELTGKEDDAEILKMLDTAEENHENAQQAT